MNATNSQNEQWFKAIKEWELTIGTKSLLLKNAEIAPYTKNTIGVTRNIKGILIPKSTQEVQSIVKIAQKYKTPLYPISGGKNWGYGSCNPVEKTSFILDLSKMKKIKDFDPELGNITVEPGVTQQDLFEFLKQNGNEFMVPTTGAGPSASILGNALERGYGLTPHSDHFEAITSFHAVLPNGDYYKPALEELGGKRINKLFKWGLGPYLDGIFTQGNFGIVTEGTLLLARRPESIATFFFSLKEDASLEGAIEAIRKIKGELGNNTGAINLMNLRRVLSMVEPYPRNKNNEQVLADESMINQLAKEHQLTEWTGFGAIYGRKEITKAVKKVIKKTLKPYVSRIHFFTERTIKVARCVKYILPNFYKNSFKKKLDTLSSALQNVSGIPSQVALPLAYWKSSNQPDMKKIVNPAIDNCGLIWHAPLVPLTPKDVRKHVEIINKVCPEYQMNPLITLTIFSEHCCDSTIPLLFNKENIQDELNAKACHDELLKKEAAEGYLPYRLGVDKMKQMINPDLPCWKFAKALKESIDENQIIAPGRYTPYQEVPHNKEMASSNDSMLPDIKESILLERA
ncbi:MAG: FAD-linked oxidase [Planctomycetota bacterium]|nr:MAG: FAD-linked oxidase [Planctomycetota bacterium]